MKLKAILETLDGLDESLKAAYTEKDGKFVLNVEGYDPAEVEVLRNTMRRAKDEKKAAEKERDDLKEKYSFLPEEFDADAYHALKDGGSGNVDQRLADQKKRLEDGFKAKEEKLTQKAETAQKQLHKLHAEMTLTTALAEASITLPHAQKAVKAMFKDQVKVEFEGDEAVVTIENMPVVEKLKAYAQTDEGKYFVTAPGNGGGGGQGGGGGGNNPKDNPWHKDGLNFTRQQEIEKADPAKATQLKAAAGIK